MLALAADNIGGDAVAAVVIVLLLWQAAARIVHSISLGIHQRHVISDRLWGCAAHGASRCRREQGLPCKPVTQYRSHQSAPQDWVQRVEVQVSLNQALSGGTKRGDGAAADRAIQPTCVVRIADARMTHWSPSDRTALAHMHSAAEPATMVRRAAACPTTKESSAAHCLLVPNPAAPNRPTVSQRLAKRGFRVSSGRDEQWDGPAAGARDPGSARSGLPVVTGWKGARVAVHFFSVVSWASGTPCQISSNSSQSLGRARTAFWVRSFLSNEEAKQKADVRSSWRGISFWSDWICGSRTSQRVERDCGWDPCQFDRLTQLPFANSISKLNKQFRTGSQGKLASYWRSERSRCNRTQPAVGLAKLKPLCTTADIMIWLKAITSGTIWYLIADVR